MLFAQQPAILVAYDFFEIYLKVIIILLRSKNVSSTIVKLVSEACAIDLWMKTNNLT